MWKKIGLPIFAVLALLILVSPTPAKAGVSFGVQIGPAYPYGYAYPGYYYSTPYPSYYSAPYPYYYNSYPVYGRYGYRGHFYTAPRRDRYYRNYHRGGYGYGRNYGGHRR